VARRYMSISFSRRPLGNDNEHVQDEEFFISLDELKHSRIGFGTKCILRCVNFLVIASEFVI